MSGFRSKLEINCAYCDWHGRRDKLANHVSSKHPNERPRTKDQSSLSNFFQSKTFDENDTPLSKRRKIEEATSSSDPCESESSRITSCPDSESDNNADVSSFQEQFKIINEALLGLNNKVDNILKINQPNQTSFHNVSEDVTSTIAGSSISIQDEELDMKLKLIRISKSVPEICQLMPCLEGGTETVKCLKCVAHYKSIPKEVATLRTCSFGIFSLPNELQLIQPIQSIEFRNFKTHLIDHLRSKAHKWCVQFSEGLERKDVMEKKENEKIGLRVARSAYSAVKEGKGGKFFERQLSLNVLNEADVGELNHSREFFREFRKNIFETIKSKICDFLGSKSLVTNRLPLVSVTADKITKMHRTYQITCLITLVNGVQTCIVVDISPCGTSHNGNALLDQLKKSLENFDINFEEQLNGMAFDGQYFDLSVDKKLANLCKNIDHDFFLPMWDLAHRLECVLNDIKKNQSFSWINTQIQTIGNVMKNYNWGIGFEELINLAKEIQVTVLNPKTYQQTRFVQSELRVYKTFERNFKLFFIDLQRKRVEFLKKGKNTEAKNCSFELKKFSRANFVFTLLGMMDILEEITKFSLICQEVNICIWTIFDYFSSMKMKLQDMMREMENNDITEENFPLLYKNLESLKVNIYQDCILVNEDTHRETRSDTQEQLLEIEDENSCSFRTSRKKLETFCKELLNRLTIRISEPPIVETMRKCFSSKFVTDPIDTQEEKIKNCLHILTKWINENRECNLNSEVLLGQLKELRKNLRNTEFFKNIIKKNENPSIKLQDNFFVKECFTNSEIYSGIPDILYLLENCLKICSEAVCESVGSVIGNHLHNRHIKFDTLFHEVFISWNGPPIHKATELLKSSLDRHFHGGRYHFTRFSSSSRLKVYKTSKVIDNLHKEIGKLQNIL